VLDALSALLAAPRSAVALVGPPGIGASTVARAAMARFRGVKLWVGGPGLAETLGTALGGPAGARLPRLGPVLVVVDHDGLPAPDGLVADLEGWRTSAPDLKILLATGAPLGLDGEVVVEIPPLTEGEVHDLLARSGPQPVPAPDALLPLLRGHPLAVHLAGRRLSVLDPLELAEKCRENPFSALRDRDAAVPRHRSLADTFGVWWSNLTRSDRTTLAELSAFGGYFDRAALQHVLGGDLDEVLDRLQPLVVRRCVRRVEGGWEVDPWMAAWARQNEPHTARSAASRLRTRLQRQLEPFGPDPHRHAEVQRFMALVGAEQHHMYAAIRDVDDAQAIVAGAHLARVAVELEMMRARPGAVDRIAPVVRFVEVHRDRVVPQDRIRVHLIFASSLARAGRFEEALESLAAVEGEGSVPGEAVVGTVHNYIGDNFLLHGQLDRAAEHYKLGLRDSEAVNDPGCGATASMQLAIIRVKQRRADEAFAHVERALRLSPTSDSPHRQARLWQNASFIFTKLQMLDRAETLLLKALEVHDQSGPSRSGALTRLQLADQALRRRGDRQESLRWLDGLPEVFRNYNDARLEHSSKGQIARAIFLDDPQRAIPLALEAATKLEELGFPEFVLTFRSLAALGFALLDEPENLKQICASILAADAGQEDTRLDAQSFAAWIQRASQAANRPDGHGEVADLRAAAEHMPEWPVDANLRAQVEAMLSRVSDVEQAFWANGDGTRLTAPNKRTVALSGVNARILAKLVQAWPRRLWCDVAELARHGWPEEQLDPSVAAGRVRVALSALRKAGLREVLERGPGGWRISPDQPVRVVPRDPS
jgi:tetratricopeptide (TPR) repeat protein